MNEEYYLEVLRLLQAVREEMVNDLLECDDLETSLELVAEVKSTNRIVDRLKTIKSRKQMQEKLTLKG